MFCCVTPRTGDLTVFKTEMPVKTRAKEKRSAVDSNPITIALKKAGPVPKSVLDAMRMREWSAFESFKTGHGTLHDLKIATELLTMCQCCIDAGIGAEAQKTCINALEILTIANLQLKNNGEIQLNDQQLEVLRILHDYHDQQRSFCSLGFYAELIDQAELIMDSCP